MGRKKKRKGMVKKRDETGLSRITGGREKLTSEMAIAIRQAGSSTTEELSNQASEPEDVATDWRCAQACVRDSTTRFELLTLPSSPLSFYLFSLSLRPSLSRSLFLSLHSGRGGADKAQ